MCHLFLNVAFTVVIDGVRKNSIDTTINPDTAIKGKKIPSINVHTIITAPNCSLFSNALSSCSADSSAWISGVMIADRIIEINARVAG